MPTSKPTLFFTLSAILLAALGLTGLVVYPRIKQRWQAPSPQFGKETFILDVDFNAIRDYIRQFMEGTWPRELKEPTCTD